MYLRVTPACMQRHKTLCGNKRLAIYCRYRSLGEWAHFWDDTKVKEMCYCWCVKKIRHHHDRIYIISCIFFCIAALGKVCVSKLTTSTRKDLQLIVDTSIPWWKSELKSEKYFWKWGNIQMLCCIGMTKEAMLHSFDIYIMQLHWDAN